MPELDGLQTVLTGFALSVPRILTALAFLPFLTHQNSSALLRSAIAAALTLPVLPLTIAQVQHARIEDGLLLLLICKESALGLCLGFATAIPFWAAEALGFVIDNQRGATTASMVNPMSGDDASPLAILVHQAYVVLFLLLGGLTIVLRVLYDSYLLWPVTAPLPTFDPAFAQHYLGLLDNLIRTAVVLAAPAMIAMLLAELALAIVSLFAPQMQVFFLAMPIKSGIALFVLVMYFPLLLTYLGNTLLDLPALLDMLTKVMQ